ncbi:hypothetical protein HLRTI_003408 [Halorhabdus tiamatea SARL4B]|jgi:hypothetical protein|uniref:SPW repeat-containing protein n=2 Tax=Halobacteriales TaxID=2235 RepID=A0ABD6C4X5_9EURY|nr:MULTISPECIES: hypothetical protein [Halobacteria]ERJ04625.1 hypothetical protein HLRTI_003408 [Halorhabdus tiamatea SARL4B]CCQ35146.1 conserved hypothetical membrane protein [Halorhabdus tiamatea SARL4B]
MATAERGVRSWVTATVDFLLAVFGFVLAFYPLVSLGNAVLGSPGSAATVNLVVGVLAFGGAYPVVAGDWSLGRLGDFAFVLIASAIGWGIIGMVSVLALDVTISGSNRMPQAIVWGAAYVTAYLVVYRTELSIYR